MWPSAMCDTGYMNVISQRAVNVTSAQRSRVIAYSLDGDKPYVHDPFSWDGVGVRDWVRVIICMNYLNLACRFDFPIVYIIWTYLHQQV